ncbi:MAG: SAF domain-containing protein [Ilumatobacteraceae bacterium]|nr:SAF domain-containing protein [Ilumatobacter sp.]
MSQLARLRRLLARRPWLYWTAAAALALLIALQVQASLAALATARQAWGTPVTVWVATAPAERGDHVQAEPRDYPAAMVPPGALTSAPDHPAARTIEVGEVLLASAVGGNAEVGAGWVVVALPSSAAPRVVAGQRLVLFGNGATLCDGVVTSPESGSTIEVAVPPGCAATAAVHAAANTLTAAIRL